MTRTLAIYPATVAVLLVALPSLAPRSGPLTLANIFSIHLTLLAICLLPVAVVRRSRELGLALGVLALVAVMRFGGDWFSLPPTADMPGGLLRTASWNLELGARAGDGAVEGIASLDVDLVVLQELGPDHARAIEASPALAQRYPHRALYPDPGVLGMGLLSAWPIARAEFSGDPSLIEAVIDVDGRPITVINGHPLAGRLEMVGALPVAFDSSHRDERLGRIRSRIDDAIGRGESVVVLGDFNVTPTEPGYLQLSEGLLDAHAEVGTGPGWTWRPSRLEFAGMGVIRIDHALSSPRLPPVAVSENCRGTGDHCMLEAAFSIEHADGMFDVEFRAEGDIAALPVTIEDRTGLVAAAERIGGDFMEPVARHPDRPEALVVSWLGGMCDRRTRIAIVPAGSTIRIGIQTERPGSCLLLGIGRAVALDFHHPVDPSIVSVEEVP